MYNIVEKNKDVHIIYLVFSPYISILYILNRCKLPTYNISHIFFVVKNIHFLTL
jgi:hypothetical protein